MSEDRPDANPSPRHVLVVEDDRLLDATPDDADPLLGKAQVPVWTGRTRDVAALPARAREAVPDCLDVWRLEEKWRPCHHRTLSLGGP